MTRTKKQARIVFDIAKRMVLNNPTLTPKVTVHKDALSYKDRTYKPLSTEARSAHELNPWCLENRKKMLVFRQCPIRGIRSS
jgi:hypothetical protein